MTNRHDHLRPMPAEARDLEDHFDELCVTASQALLHADVLLVVTGAGFSADSGLAVYGGIAKVPAYEERGLEYSDLSQPRVLDDDPELFYGFWGQSFNDYRRTRPHDGYGIISRWRDDVNRRGEVDGEIRARIREKVSARRPFDSEEVRLNTPYETRGGPAGAFHVFTSNVDAHCYDHFEAYEIHDCHGSIELWQCSDRECDESGIWRAPMEHEFLVDKGTMLAPKRKDSTVLSHDETTGSQPDAPKEEGMEANVGRTKGTGERTRPLQHMPQCRNTHGWRQGEGSNWPECAHCGGLARPAIFMFGDHGWKWDRSQEIRWKLWVETVLEVCDERGGINVCIVEIGCGPNVPTTRTCSETMVEDVVERGCDAQLVRINPDFPLAPRGSTTAGNMIPIMSRGLTAVRRIDEMYRHSKELKSRYTSS